MALDQSFGGRTYPPTPAYEVGREKIREFAEAVGDTHPAYVDREAARELGHADVIAPPTFVFSITYRAAGVVVQDPQLGLDYSRGGPGGQKVSLVGAGGGGPADGHGDDREHQDPGGQRLSRHSRGRARRGR